MTANDKMVIFVVTCLHALLRALAVMTLREFSREMVNTTKHKAIARFSRNTTLHTMATVHSRPYYRHQFTLTITSVIITNAPLSTCRAVFAINAEVLVHCEQVEFAMRGRTILVDPAWGRSSLWQRRTHCLDVCYAVFLGQGLREQHILSELRTTRDRWLFIAHLEPCDEVRVILLANIREQKL